MAISQHSFAEGLYQRPRQPKVPAQVTCPSVTNYFPRIGYSGYGLTIIGENFNGVTAVKFTNNVSATFEIINNKEIRVVVPIGAVSGLITISKQGCPDVMTDTFTVPPAPAISLTPASQFVGVGDSVPITVNFSRGLIVSANLTIASSNPGIVSAPSFLAIPPGAITTPFKVKGLMVGAPATITATLPPNLGGASATVTVTVTPRVVQASSIAVLVGDTVRVPIELTAQGDENQINFSTTFDPTLLNNPQVSLGSDIPGATLTPLTTQISQGRIGIKLEMPPGQGVSAGTKQIAVVQFDVTGNSTPGTTPIGFDDQPLIRGIGSPAGVSLPTYFRPGTVTIANGYEGDSTPRPKGDGALTVADWTQIGRFIAGIDVLSAGNEFQRADCAPRETLGNGILSVTDWVQAGRYVTRIDPITIAGGPSTPVVSSLIESNAAGQGKVAQTRILRMVNSTFARDQANTLNIELDAQGNENAVGFSLNFDPNALTYAAVNVGSSVGASVLIVNDTQATSGRLGIALALPTGQRILAGTRTIVTVFFNAVAGRSAAMTHFTFGDQPIRREISDVNAVALTAKYHNCCMSLDTSSATVCAASFLRQTPAAEPAVMAFDKDIVLRPAAASSLALKGSAATERLVLPFFVGSTQIDFQLGLLCIGNMAVSVATPVKYWLYNVPAPSEGTDFDTDDS